MTACARQASTPPLAPCRPTKPRHKGTTCTVAQATVRYARRGSPCQPTNAPPATPKLLLIPPAGCSAPHHSPTRCHPPQTNPFIPHARWGSPHHSPIRCHNLQTNPLIPHAGCGSPHHSPTRCHPPQTNSLIPHAGWGLPHRTPTRCDNPKTNPFISHAGRVSPHHPPPTATTPGPTRSTAKPCHPHQTSTKMRLNRPSPGAT